MKKVFKIIGIVIGCILLLTCILLAVVYIKSQIDANKPYLSDNYFDDFKSGSPLESEYAGRGTYEVSSLQYDHENKSIDKISIWYPTELETSNKTYPMIVVVNASNTRARNYIPFFDRLASWGFIVVGNEDPQTGNGETASLTLDYMINLPSDSVLFGKIDLDNIGIIGYSQGGAGAINAVIDFDNGSYYKTIFTGSAAYALLSQNMGWGYEISQIEIPYFMAAGTGSSDDSGNYGDDQFAGVSPLFSQEDNYNGITADVFKVRGRIIGAEHGDVMVLSDGYMTAWMIYQLQGDERASMVFLGEDAEILSNSNWQDVEKNN